MLKSILVALIVVQSCFASDLKFSFDGDIGYLPKAISQAYIFPKEYKSVSHNLFDNAYDKIALRFSYNN